jgi:hypothetical protein
MPRRNNFIRERTTAGNDTSPPRVVRGERREKYFTLVKVSVLGAEHFSIRASVLLSCGHSVSSEVSISWLKPSGGYGCCHSSLVVFYEVPHYCTVAAFAYAFGRASSLPFQTVSAEVCGTCNVEAAASVHKGKLLMFAHRK